MIYILDNDSEKTAKALDDRSLDRMIKDIAQVLYETHYCILSEKNEHLSLSKLNKKLSMLPKRSSLPKYVKWAGLRMDDPWILWARECVLNYLYLIRLGIDCCREYHYRYSENCDIKKVEDGNDHCGAWHKMRDVIDWARDNVPDFPEGEKDWLSFVGGDMYQLKEIQLPLIMPKKYQKNSLVDSDGDIIPDIIKCYRNYYQAKLNQKLNKCNSIFESSNEVSGGCKENNNFVEIKWTNKEKPFWITF